MWLTVDCTRTLLKKIPLSVPTGYRDVMMCRLSSHVSTHARYNRSVTVMGRCNTDSTLFGVIFFPLSNITPWMILGFLLLEGSSTSREITLNRLSGLKMKSLIIFLIFFSENCVSALTIVAVTSLPVFG